MGSQSWGLYGSVVETAPQDFSGGGCGPPRQHRFARTTATGDDHTTEVGIHGHQKESRLGGVTACDGSQGQDSSPEEDKSGQEDRRAEELGAVIIADCNGPPVLQLGKDVLDFVTHLVQPLVVMDRLLAVAGWDVR